MRRILVTGSRDWDNRERTLLALGEALGELSTQLRAAGFEDWKSAKHYVLVSGNARGADRLAEEVWLSIGMPEETIERHPALWRVYGKQAGFIRNEEMVNLGADRCLAFLMPCMKPEHANQEPHSSHGGDHTATLAEKAGIETRRITS